MAGRTQPPGPTASTMSPCERQRAYMIQPAAARRLFVVFGATRDLARRKLLPALYRLHEQGGLGAR
ncbi:MAG: hypothetical protein ACT4OO_14185 [Nitrospiraceae bacterium]